MLFGKKKQDENEEVKDKKLMGADEETALLAQKLCGEYGFIYYTTSEKYESMKDSFTKD